jgi:hypothetical protein
MKDYILVLGSKPDSILPDINPVAIYTANDAAILAKKYKEKDESVYLTCIVGSGAIAEKKDMQKRVIEVNPDRVIARRNKADIKKILGSSLPNAELFNISDKDQYILQRKTFGLRVIKAEMMVHDLFFEKLKKIIKFPIKKPLILSTGCFAFLYAAIENPQKKIIISGISLVSGKHFFGNDLFGSRANADRYLIPKIPNHIRDRSYTLNLETSNYSKIKLLQKT